MVYKASMNFMAETLRAQEVKELRYLFHEYLNYAIVSSAIVVEHATGIQLRRAFR